MCISLTAKDVECVHVLRRHLCVFGEMPFQIFCLLSGRLQMGSENSAYSGYKPFVKYVICKGLSACRFFLSFLHFTLSPTYGIFSFLNDKPGVISKSSA